MAMWFAVSLRALPQRFTVFLDARLACGARGAPSVIVILVVAVAGDVYGERVVVKALMQCHVGKARGCLVFQSAHNRCGQRTRRGSNRAPYLVMPRTGLLAVWSLEGAARWFVDYWHIGFHCCCTIVA